MRSMEWDNSCLKLLNQTLLPGKVEYRECRDYRAVAEAIRRLEVRGAPAIGAAAAFAFVLGAREIVTENDFFAKLAGIAAELKQTRPTAINLSWAIEKMRAVVNAYPGSKEDKTELLTALETEAINIYQQDENVNHRISQYGASLFDKPTAVLTHCNAGALATVAWGTALGVIRAAWSQGKIDRVYADETRPLLQGARLTAWELQQDNIPVTLITDNMAGWIMKKKLVQSVIVGADRITANGDVANKIGTYSVAVLAKQHNIPFYVAAPVSTFDFAMYSGEDIPIEERQAEEVTVFAGHRIAPESIDVFNPAFDVTPSSFVTAIITEFGLLRSPYSSAISKLKIMKDGMHNGIND
ncbi:MAG: S-methyl-5-thioribose-1-phosphate isomerase [Veillonellales bacterium]